MESSVQCSPCGIWIHWFVDGTITCPAPSHEHYDYGKRQDQLILYAIISMVDSNVIIMQSGNVKTSKEAWDILHKSFASSTRAQITHLKECLSRFTKDLILNVALCTQGYSINFEELHDFLAHFENYWKMDKPVGFHKHCSCNTKGAINMGTTQTIHPPRVDLHLPVKKIYLLVLWENQAHYQGML